MLQRLDVPIQSLTTETTTLHTDYYFPSIVNALKKCKNSFENDKRLENFHWRLWRRGSTQSTTSSTTSAESIGETWSNCSYESSPSTATSSFSLSSHTSTFVDTKETETTVILPSASIQQQSKNHCTAGKFFVSELEYTNNNHADHRSIQCPSTEDKTDDHNDTDDDNDGDDDDESTLFGEYDDDDGDNNNNVENTVCVSGDMDGGSTISDWPSEYEFTKKQAPLVDQRSLLSSMLLHGASTPAPFTNSNNRMKSSSLSMFISSPPAATMLTWIDDDVLSSSMKQHVDWEKLQNGGPAAGLMGITKKIQGTSSSSSNPASSMTLVCDTLDTFTGCW